MPRNHFYLDKKNDTQFNFNKFEVCGYKIMEIYAVKFIVKVL